MQDAAGSARASFPLSAAQLPLWLLDHRVGSKRAQQIEGCLLRVQGEINSGRLSSTIGDVVRRHPALRSCCELAAELPHQRVHDEIGWKLAEVDFSALPPELARSEAERWCALVSSVPFDLDSPPLWRVGLARMPGSQSLLALAAHHLICDGWTLRLLLEELSDGYRTGLPGPPEPGGLAQYPQCLLDRDHAWRQNHAVTAHWRGVLNGCSAPRLAVSRAAGPDGSGHPTAQAPVSADVSRLVREAARRHHVTVFLVFAAVYAITIGWFSGASLVPVASAFHGRRTPALKGVAGVFTTMFVLPANLTGDPSFSGFLSRLVQTYRVCLANRNVLLEELALERKLTREPFFRHAISYHPVGFTVSDFAGMPAAMDLISAKHVANELELHVRELPDSSFALQLRFDPAVLGAASAQIVLGAYGRLLASLTASPERSIASNAAELCPAPWRDASDGDRDGGGTGAAIRPHVSPLTATEEAQGTELKLLSR